MATLFLVGGLNSRSWRASTRIALINIIRKNSRVDFRIITMDQRNASGGESIWTGSKLDWPWNAFADASQLGYDGHGASPGRQHVGAIYPASCSA